jgi:hypothetical protein
LLYFLATTAKEVYVPLAALLPLLPFADLRRRVRHALPFAAAAGLYALWRIHMLGWSNSAVGYGTRSTALTAHDLLALPSAIGLARPAYRLLAASLLVAALFVLWRRHGWSVRLAAVGLAAALSAPLAPLLPNLEPRHFFLPIFFASAAVGAALQALSQRSRRTLRWPLLAAALALLAGSLGLLTGTPRWRHHFESVAHHRAEGSFILFSEDDGVLLTTLNDSTFLSCTASLRRLVGRDPGPGFCGDPCWCSQRLAGERAWRYGGGAAGVTLAGPVEQVSCASRRPLRVAMRYDEERGRLTWELGPSAHGSYGILLVTDAERPQVSIPHPLPRRGEAAWLLSEPLRFVVRHVSHEGLPTYSPVLILEAPADGGPAELLWESEERAPL